MQGTRKINEQNPDRLKVEVNHDIFNHDEVYG